MNWLDEMEARDKAYPGTTAYVWSCPACGSDLIEDEGGMRCPGYCQRRWSWAELGKDGI